MSYGQALLRKPSRIRVVDDVRQSLENAILSGVMRPGERLLEIRLACELGVSRTTVREALLMLVERGLAVSVPRRGTFVTRLSARDALEVSMLRSLLEALAISAARASRPEGGSAASIDSAMLDSLAELIQELYTCQLPRDIPHVIEIDRKFHTCLVEAAEMPRLYDLWAALSGRVGALMLRSIETKHLTLDFLVQLHQEYIDELRTGDPDRMVAAVVHHYVDSQVDPVGHVQPIDQARVLALVEIMANNLAAGQQFVRALRKEFSA